jgi:hypothetical protein
MAPSWTQHQMKLSTHDLREDIVMGVVVKRGDRPRGSDPGVDNRVGWTQHQMNMTLSNTVRMQARLWEYLATRLSTPGSILVPLGESESQVYVASTTGYT